MRKEIDLNNDNQWLIEVVQYTLLLLVLPFLFVMIYLNDPTMLSSFISVENMKIMYQTIIEYSKNALYLLVCGAIFFFCYRFIQLERYERKGYTKEQVKDFRRTVKQMKHLKVSLKRIKADIEDDYPNVTVEREGNTYILDLYKNHWFNLEQVQKNTDFFKSVFKLPLYQVVEDYDKITLIFTAEEQKLHYTEFYAMLEKGKILIGYDNKKQPVFWDFNVVPHLLGVGTTGSGKSNFMKVVIDSLILNGAEMKFADGKRVELVTYAFMGYEVYTDNFVELFQRMHKIMMNRYKRMEDESKQRKEQISHYTLLKTPPKPYFLIVDEWASIGDNLSRENPKGGGESDYKKAMRLLKDILQLGRASGVQVIAFMQDPKATTLDTSLRNNFNMRVLLGAVKEKQAYDMLFGSEYRNLEPQKTGSGYYMGAEMPQVFKVPLWEDMRQLE